MSGNYNEKSKSKYVIFDLFGTILNDSFVNDAQIIRNRVLNIDINPNESDKAKDTHYKVIQKTIEESFYLPENVNVKLTENSDSIKLSKQDLKTTIQTFLFLLGFLYNLKNKDANNYLINGSKEFLDYTKGKGYSNILLSNVICPIQDSLVSYYNLSIDFKACQAMNLAEDEKALKIFGNYHFKKVQILEESSKHLNLEDVKAVVGDDLIKDGLVSLYLSVKYNKPVKFYHYVGEGSNKAAINYKLEDLINTIKNSKFNDVLNVTDVEKTVKEWYSNNYEKFEKFEELHNKF